MAVRCAVQSREGRAKLSRTAGKEDEMARLHAEWDALSQKMELLLSKPRMFVWQHGHLYGGLQTRAEAVWCAGLNFCLHDRCLCHWDYPWPCFRRYVCFPCLALRCASPPFRLSLECPIPPHAHWQSPKTDLHCLFICTCAQCCTTLWCPRLAKPCLQPTNEPTNKTTLADTRTDTVSHFPAHGVQLPAVISMHA